MLFTYKDISKDLIEHPDVCIIGSGAGGAVMADVLSRAGLDVVVVEEGGYYDKARYGNYKPYESLKILYRDYGATFALSSVPIMIPIGRAIGGTTVINSGTCFRTPEAILDEWSESFGVLKASYKDMETYFDRVEKTINVVPVDPNILGKNGLIFKRGADALGLSNGMLKHNIINCHGCGRCAFGCPTDAKQAVHLNFIPSAIKHGTRIYANAKVEKIILEGRIVKEVRGSILNEQTENKLYNFTIKPKLLVISAGAIYTPYILDKNGIKLSPELGKNLTIHPAARVAAMFDELVEGYKGVPQGNYVDAYASEGIMFEGIFVPPEVGLSVAGTIGLEAKEFALHYNNLATFGVMVSDHNSSGNVRSGIDNKPFISYRLHPYDTKKLVKAVAIAAEIFFAAGAKWVNPSIYGFESFKKQDEISKLFKRKINAKSFELMAFHPLGTARMGELQGHTVVNSYGKVHNLDNMFISDGSIVPTSLGVNPQITIMSLSMRNAEHIIENKVKFLK